MDEDGNFRSSSFNRKLFSLTTLLFVERKLLKIIMIMIILIIIIIIIMIKIIITKN